MLDNRWEIKQQPDDIITSELSASINVSTPIATILAQRGITDFDSAKDFFRPTKAMLHDPFLMKDMDKAVARVEAAIANEQNILVYGDYDVDGTTSVALMFHFLNSFYNHCEFYIPDRYKEGYGISAQSIEWAHENNIDLIICLDCGIKSVDLIARAKSYNIDFIICDHHNPGEALPPAVAVLDPKRGDCNYPYKELPGCGIGFKLMQALVSKNPTWHTDPYNFLDLVVVSIASDIVPITGENRTLAALGIKYLEKHARPGIKALMRLANMKDDITITSIVFGLAPKINAAGRISHATTAVELLLADSEEEALHFADKLHLKNELRKDFDSSITAEALQMIEGNDLLKTAKTTVLFKDDWHKGVIGIVASRCIESYYRPTIIMTQSNGKATGSARSVPGFDVYEAISSCSELLNQFGGHKYAAGLTLEIDKVADFQRKFEEVVSNTIPEELLTPLIEIDTELNFDNITSKFVNILKQMAPFGPENHTPVFLAKEVKVARSLRILKSKHLKFIAEQAGNKSTFDVIGFNLAEHEPVIKNGIPFNMAFSVEENNYMGRKSIQLKLRDIKFE